MKTRVEIQIDELVLEGFARADRFAIAESLSLELERLIETGEAGGLTRLTGAAHIRAAGLRLVAGAKPQAIGAQVARAVHDSLKPGPARGAK